MQSSGLFLSPAGSLCLPEGSLFLPAGLCLLPEGSYYFLQVKPSPPKLVIIPGQKKRGVFEYSNMSICLSVSPSVCLLTDDQDQQVERLQSGALKCIYGYGTSYVRMRELAGVSTLRQRRIEASDKFAKKSLGIPRFSSWFPASRARSGRRGGEAYLEEHVRCDWLFNTPIYYMRRRLNGKNGRKYGERNREYTNEEFRNERTAGLKGRKNTQTPK